MHGLDFILKLIKRQKKKDSWLIHDEETQQGIEKLTDE